MIEDLKFTGCIVLYNNDIGILRDAIDSFLDSPISYKLYLIDNSPTDSLKTTALDDRVEYFHNPSNPGFGAAHNIAIERAMKEGSKYHLVLNPDVYFSGEIFSRIIDYMETHPNVGNLMPKVLYPNGSIQFLCKLLPTPYDWIGRRFNPIKSLVDKRNELFELRSTNYKKIMQVPYLSGCFMFLRVEVLKEVGTFDEGIFMYGEEADLCRRIISKGYNTMFFPEVSIFHHFEKGSHKSWKLTWIGIKSAIYYFNKWGWIFDRERKRINQEVVKTLRLGITETERSSL